MPNQNRYLADLGQINTDRVLEFSKRLVARPAIEIYHGITAKTINWFVCLAPGVVFNILILVDVDRVLFHFTKRTWLHQPTGPWGYLFYCVAGDLSGFAAWGLWQTILHNQVSKRLTEAFQNAGLKNAVGKLPGFIFDKPIDEFTRTMRLTRASLPVSQFRAAKEHLESALQVYIDEIKENRERGTIDITYASLAIPKIVKLTNIETFGKNKFLVGETRARKIEVELDEIPHFLIGGQSGGGKSTFLRQLITTLYLNNKTYKFILIDLKDGLEFQIFEKLERVNVVSKASTALYYLKKIEGELKTRMEFLKVNKCKDIAAYFEKKLEERREMEKSHFNGQLFSRTIVVIDEAAELFMASDKAQASQAQKAKGYAIKIAAQGRAVGIHVIIATQRPDVRAVDGQIKANLPGALAFQMPNNASSMTILDSGRAAQLPQIKGRAIWKSGLETVELQAPFLTVDDTNKLLASHRKETTTQEVPNEVEP